MRGRRTPPRPTTRWLRWLATAPPAYGDGAAAMFLRDGEWQSLTYDELWQRVRDVALGLVALGVERGDRVAVLANTRGRVRRRRPRHQHRRGGRRAGVPDRTPPTSASGWSATRGAASIVCENAGQVAKIDEVRANLPDLEHVVVIDGDGAGPMTLDELARARPRAATSGELDSPDRRPSPTTTAASIIYTSGTTGRAQGRACSPTVASPPAARRPGDASCSAAATSAYLYLPLAHVFAQIMPGRHPRGRRRAGVLGRRPQPDHRRAGPGASRPYCRRCRGSSRRSTRWRWRWSPPEREEQQPPQAVELGVEVRAPRSARRGRAPTRSGRRSSRPTRRCSAACAGSSAASIKLAISGAAPIAPEILRVLLRRRRAGDGGLGDDRDDGDRHAQPARALQVRHASAGPSPAPTIRIAEDGEIEMAGPI